MLKSTGQPEKFKPEQKPADPNKNPHAVALSGGWRIVRTMGARLTKLKPRSEFCAETGAAGAVLLATHFGLPVSTTHAIAVRLRGLVASTA